MKSQIYSFIWYLKETSQGVQSDDKLHSLVIFMIIYDLRDKLLVLHVFCCPGEYSPGKVIIAMVFCSVTYKMGLIAFTSYTR